MFRAGSMIKNNDECDFLKSSAGFIMQEDWLKGLNDRPIIPF